MIWPRSQSCSSELGRWTGLRKRPHRSLERMAPDVSLDKVCKYSMPFNHCKYNWPSMLADSVSENSTSHRLKIYIFKFVVVVQSLSHVQLFVIPWAAAHQASLSFTISWSLDSSPLSQWCHPTISSSKIKTWICPALANIFIAFTLYLQLFSYNLYCIRYYK